VFVDIALTDLTAVPEVNELFAHCRSRAPECRRRARPSPPIRAT
jgi:hypothetical protein